MPFSRPTIQELIARNEAEFDSRFPGGDARLRNSNLNVLARVNAGGVHGLHGHLDWIALQLMIDTAEAEHLARHASIWGVSRIAATFAIGAVTVTGKNGAFVPAGTTLRRGDGIEYTTNADATIVGGTAQANVTASLAGASGNAAVGVSLAFVSPIAGVNGQVTVSAGGLTAGVDEEDDDSLRSRLLDRIQAPPHGGNAHDYEAWAREVAGVTRAWVYPGELGLGTVTVRFVMDDKVGTIIPSGAEVAAVQAYIDARRPVTAQVTVVEPVAVPLDLTIQLTPGTQAVRDAVTAELADLLRRDAAPGATILVSRIREAVSVAAGETDNVVTVPAANVAHATGQIAVLGVITWL
jgi:uncharacterized phage protein gp47/JayE